MERLRLNFHFSFFVALAIYALLGQAMDFVSYALAMVLHEIAHYLVASRLFYRCRQMQISCFGAVLYGDFQDAGSTDVVLIALAGPVANMLFALLAVAFWWIFPSTYYFTSSFVWGNVSMAVVNLMPVYPLDGGRVAVALLQRFTSKKRSLRIVRTFALAFAAALILVFVVALFCGELLLSMVIFAIFLLCSAFAKGKTAFQRLSFLQNFSKRMVRGVEKKTLVFDVNATVSSVAKRMVGGSLYDVEIWHQGKLVKRISFCQLDKLLQTSHPNDRLVELSCPS